MVDPGEGVESQEVLAPMTADGTHGDNSSAMIQDILQALQQGQSVTVQDPGGMPTGKELS